MPMQHRMNMKQIVSVFVLVMVLVTISFACDEGWQAYNGHCYKWYNTPNTRAAAQNACHDEGAYLSCIEDDQENAHVAAVATNQRTYIGDTDQGSEGTWTCTDAIGSSFVSVWWRGEPNNCCGGENCAEINFGGEGMWNDCGCHVRFPSVCEKARESCSEPWVRHESSCYLNVESELNFNEAEANCISHEAHLVCVDSTAENIFVAEVAGGHRAWTGHTDNGHEGVWMCLGEDATPGHWRSPEPNNCCSGEHCAETNFGGIALWNDVGCGTSLPYICEKEDEQLTLDVICDDGWDKHNEQCYKLFPRANFQSSKETCRSSGARNVCIKDEDENIFIASLANGQRTWIGHVDSGTEGLWHCDMEDTLSDPWWRGEPNNCCSGEDCAEINFGNSYKWNDNNCEARLPFVCEKNLPCGEGWSEELGRCYLYKAEAMTWNGAMTDCQMINADLACVDSDAENLAVGNIAGLQRAWIGSTDSGHEGSWMCNGEADGHWWNNEPNDWGSGEDCSEINFGERGRWNDVRCNAEFPFICAKNAHVIDQADFISNFFSHCVSDSQTECKNLIESLIEAINPDEDVMSCVKIQEFLGDMTGTCVVVENN